MKSHSSEGRLNFDEMASFEEVLYRFKRGEPVLLLDAVNRENEGDVVFAADAVTPELISFLMLEARGLICVSISEQIANALQLPFQVDANNSPFQTPFAVSIDAKCVVPRGVTAEGRAITVKSLVGSALSSTDFVTPGHIFPLIANDAGVLRREGHTEGVYDLTRLAKLAPVGVLCEVLNSDGSTARGVELERFAVKHGMAVTTIEAIKRYRIQNEVAVRHISSSPVRTEYGRFIAHLFVDDAGHKEHVALVRGDFDVQPGKRVPLVRIHSECLTGDVFGSRRCDCGEQLEEAMRQISEEDFGALLYLRQEGRGIGLENKLKAYALQDQGRDTVEANLELGFRADERDFAVGAHILRALHFESIRLMTNNPQKALAMEQYGIRVAERIPVVASPNPCNSEYLTTKKKKMGHHL